jgi:hypothetical protein
LQIQETDLLPENHLQIVQACMNGEIRECGVEVKTRDRIFALTYHPIASFKLVYLYAIEMTEFRRAEEDLLRIASKTLALAKHAVQRLQAFRKTMPHPPQPHRQQNSSTEMFVAMDGCVFVSGDRLGEWDLD